jgi:anti-sigma-K factor RskA
MTADDDDDDHEGLAAEYVLGTLDAFEREQVEALMGVDPNFVVLVRRWEGRLGELNAMVPAVEPPPETWEKIKAQIAGLESSVARPPAVGLIAPAAPRATSESAGAEIMMLSQRVRRWRGLAAATTLLAACLALVVGAREFSPHLLPDALRPPSVAQASGRLVAVLQRDADSPAFLLTVDVANRSLTVRRVAADPQAGKSYELWLVSNRFPAPRSLGVLSPDTFTVRPLQATYDPDILEAATYAVSLEPEGGSPTGTPTGPVLYLGKLVEATPPRT